MLRYLFLAAAFSSQMFGATYQFPTSEKLAKYAQWPLKNASFHLNEKSEFSLNYQLPGNAVGTQKVAVKMVGKKELNPFPVKGDLGTGACMETKVSVVCMVSMDKLKVPLPEVLAFLDKKYNKSPELVDRKAVAKAFSSEPIGIITFDKAQ